MIHLTRMLIFLKRILILIIGLAIMIGVPYQFGWGWLFGSWIPALFAVTYLED